MLSSPLSQTSHRKHKNLNFTFLRIIRKKWLQNRKECVIMRRVSAAGHAYIGMSPSGKAPDFDSGIRRFKSCHPSQNRGVSVFTPPVHDPLAQLAEQLPFKQWVWSSNLQRVTKNMGIPKRVSPYFYARRDSNHLNATVRWTVARGSLMPRNLYSRHSRECKRISSGSYGVSHHTEIRTM